MTSYIQEFEQQIVPKYRNYYVSYTQLLDAIELLKDRQQETDSAGGLLKGLILPKDFTFGDTTAMYGLLEQRPEVRFVSLLQHEVSKLNHFTQLEVRTLLSILRQIQKKLDRIASGDEEDSISRRVFPSLVDESEASLSLDEKLVLIRNKIRDQANELIVLEEYIAINLRTISRLTDEFDKRFEDSPPVSPWFLSSLSEEPFSKTPLDGLFCIVAALYNKCASLDTGRLVRRRSGARLSAFSIPKVNSLRVKLLLAEEALLEESMDDFAVPTRPGDLVHVNFCSSLCHRIDTIGDSSVKSISWRRLRADMVMASGEVRTNLSVKEEVLPLVSCVPSMKATVSRHEETRFQGAVFIDHVRSQILEDCNLAETLQSPQIAQASFPTSSVLFIDETIPAFTAVKMFIGEALDPNVNPAIPIEDSLATPKPQMRHSASTFSVPGMASPQQKPILTPPTVTTHSEMIYPKNYMANERSVLAWISATAVQAGIGIAFLAKPGLSFIGAVICLVSLWFLWWSIIVFVRRFRQLKSKTPEGEYLFYNMDLPTAFGLVQLVILVTQTLCMLVI